MQKRVTATATTLTLVVLIGLGTGCRAMTGRSLGTNIDDKITTAQVKARLSAQDWHNLTWVDVDTKSGIVYLTGNVRSEAEAQRAHDLAHSNAGVRQVITNLHVPGAARAASDAQPATR